MWWWPIWFQPTWNELQAFYYIQLIFIYQTRWVFEASLQVLNIYCGKIMICKRIIICCSPVCKTDLYCHQDIIYYILHLYRSTSWRMIINWYNNEFEIHFWWFQRRQGLPPFFFWRRRNHQYHHSLSQRWKYYLESCATAIIYDEIYNITHGKRKHQHVQHETIGSRE